jgi:hypothetical protein
MSSAAQARDDLTRERLMAAAAYLPGLMIEEFSADWWDGQAHGPCLVIRGGRGGRRQRVVETGGEAVIVPFARRSAERWLADRRKPRRVELVVPEPRPAGDVAVDGVDDAVRCPTPACGAMIPLDYAGGCPVCGDSVVADLAWLGG